MAGPSSKPHRPPPALQKSLSRRVSFNESTITGGKPHARPPISDFDAESQFSSAASAGGGGATRRRNRFCGSCCACFSIAAAVLLAVALLGGGIYFAFLQSNLPEVRFQRLDVSNITIDGETLMAASFDARLNATNGSGRVELRYVEMTAEVSSEGIEFPGVRLPDLRQSPHGTSEIRVRAAARRMVVEEAAGKDLKEKATMRVLVVSVVVRGHISYHFGGRQIDGLPFKIDCHSIDQTEIDSGHAPRCNTKLSPIG
ncbi:Unknown protein [Striga hermonthica]|uniref:Late embryogenesis abundant protein LEA-2 subgroup domain-containing protein n=1 Tax=Striga hermonthica TaxID=68872 RepID=A0A9N7N275_STRHE|nr:Unknown protein [Striga hermonthica]